MKPEDEQDRRTANENGRPTEQHTPIIITDGSASIEFDRDEYPEVSPGVFRSQHPIHISQVQIVDRNQQNNEHICGFADPSRNHHVKVLCAGKDFDMARTNDGLLEIRFDRVEYPEVGAGPSRRKFRQVNRQIMGLEIRNHLGAVVHTCRLVPGHRNFDIKISDDHA